MKCELFNKYLKILVVYALYMSNLYAACTGSYHIDLSEIIYLNQDSLKSSIEGRNGVAKLGNGNNRRVYYNDSSLDQISIKASEEIKKTIEHIFPFAVIVEGTLYNKDDDLCTMVPEKWRGVDLTDPCMLHDYCYYRIADYENNGNSFREAFNNCQDKFLDDMRQAKRDQFPNETKPMFGLLYYVGVKYIPYSFSNYVRNQDKNALMYSLILERAKKDKEFEKLIEDSNILNLRKMEKQVKSYCHALETDTYTISKRQHRKRIRKQVSYKETIKHQSHKRDKLKKQPLFGCGDISKVKYYN